jgi:hypothetical protein
MEKPSILVRSDDLLDGTMIAMPFNQNTFSDQVAGWNLFPNYMLTFYAGTVI